ncbi:MAG: Hpt domain-containing protein, partial [Myxococcaceae bacterium]
MFHELAREFSEEAKVLLEQLERDLLSLEAESSAEFRGQASSRIRRALHTLKGNAGLLGTPSLQSALHRMEDAVGALATEPSQVAWLLGAVDVVREEVEAIAAGRAVEQATEDLLRLASGELAAEDDASTEANFLAGAEVRVPRERLDQLLAATGELVVTNTQLQKLLASGGLNPKQSVHWMDRLDRTARLLHELVVKARTLPVRTLLSRFGRLVRDDARHHGREAKLEVSGEHVQVDRVVLEALGAPLMHLVRNAVIHGVEPADARRAQGKPRTGTVSLE